MRTSTVAGSALALVLLIGCTSAADDLKSGPQVGDPVKPFEPLNVTGPLAPDKACLV
jgi:hypothetical protein